ncbi:MAG: hypothetical protein B7W96_00745 [Parcubacteria group bacterium 37-58-5]|nr:MAG: hypothetical protein B7W96_00745 [Parcubacteria group bacterium 37-58-5]
MEGTAAAKAHRLTGHPWLVLTTVMVGTLLIGLDRTVVNLALPKVMSDFGITVETAAWIATAYIISNAIFVPVFGKLGDLLGNRVIYFWSFIGFIIVSMLAGLSWDFNSLLVFRVLQGLVGAAVYPTAMSLIAKSFADPKARAQALGIWSSSFAISAVIGPLLGGYLVDNFSWRWVFFINLPIGIAGLIMTLLFLPHDRPEERGTFDWFGAVLLSVVISSLVLVVDRGQDWGWLSSASILCYLLTLVFGVFVYLWETRHTHPIIDFKFFRNPVIVSVLAVSFISFGGMMGAMLLLPVFAQTFLHYTATQSGYLFVPMALALPLFAPLGAKLANSFNRRRIRHRHFQHDSRECHERERALGGAAFAHPRHDADHSCRSAGAHHTEGRPARVRYGLRLRRRRDVYRRAYRTLFPADDEYGRESYPT